MDSFGGVREPLQLCRKGRLRRIPPYGTDSGGRQAPSLPGLRP